MVTASQSHMLCPMCDPSSMHVTARLVAISAKAHDRITLVCRCNKLRIPNPLRTDFKPIIQINVSILLSQPVDGKSLNFKVEARLMVLPVVSEVARKILKNLQFSDVEEKSIVAWTAAVQHVAALRVASAQGPG